MNLNLGNGNSDDVYDEKKDNKLSNKLTNEDKRELQKIRWQGQKQIRKAFLDSQKKKIKID